MDGRIFPTFFDPHAGPLETHHKLAHQRKGIDAAMAVGFHRRVSIRVRVVDCIGGERLDIVLGEGWIAFLDELWQGLLDELFHLIDRRVPSDREELVQIQFRLPCHRWCDSVQIRDNRPLLVRSKSRRKALLHGTRPGIG